MAQVVVSLKIMPVSPEVEWASIKKKAMHLIGEFGGAVGKEKLENIAFGLQALVLVFVMDEKLGSTESLENKISMISGVQSVEVTDVRRAIG
ncbi:MAG TPA: elongation factor 1-beta [Candidatus Nanoarchaeia archaeon]|nr:elongation factor 1-beta [Candidatus Nanoarchaeia archaeon]